MDSGIEKKIIEAMENAFGVDLQGKSLSECTPEAIEEWDSLSFLNFVLSLEEMFNISLNPDTIAQMSSGGEIIASLIEKELA